MVTASTFAAVSHRDIVDRAGGPAAIARKVSEYEEKQERPPVEANTTKAWKRLNSIPSPYWQAIAEMRIATLDELADGAARKRVEA